MTSIRTAYSSQPTLLPQSDAAATRPAARCDKKPVEDDKHRRFFKPDAHIRQQMLMAAFDHPGTDWQSASAAERANTAWFQAVEPKLRDADPATAECFARSLGLRASLRRGDATAQEALAEIMATAPGQFVWLNAFGVHCYELVFDRAATDEIVVFVTDSHAVDRTAVDATAIRLPLDDDSRAKLLQVLAMSVGTTWTPTHKLTAALASIGVPIRLSLTPQRKPRRECCWVGGRSAVISYVLRTRMGESAGAQCHRDLDRRFVSEQIRTLKELPPSLDNLIAKRDLADAELLLNTSNLSEDGAASESSSTRDYHDRIFLLHWLHPALREDYPRESERIRTETHARLSALAAEAALGELDNLKRLIERLSPAETGRRLSAACHGLLPVQWAIAAGHASAAKTLIDAMRASGHARGIARKCIDAYCDSVAARMWPRERSQEMYALLLDEFPGRTLDLAVSLCLGTGDTARAVAAIKSIEMSRLMRARAPDGSPLVAALLKHEQRDLASACELRIRESEPQVLTTALPGNRNLLHLVSALGPELTLLVVSKCDDEHLAQMLSQRSENGRLALEPITRHADIRVLDAICQRAEHDHRLRECLRAPQNQEQQTPLMLAARLKNPDALRLLLQQGNDTAGLHERAATGATALHLAVYGRRQRNCEILLDAGARATDMTPAGETPLDLALRDGQYETAAILVEHGAPVDVDGLEQHAMLKLGERLSQRGATSAVTVFRPRCRSYEEALRSRVEAVLHTSGNLDDNLRHEVRTHLAPALASGFAPDEMPVETWLELFGHPTFRRDLNPSQLWDVVLATFSHQPARLASLAEAAKSVGIEVPLAVLVPAIASRLDSPENLSALLAPVTRGATHLSYGTQCDMSDTLAGHPDDLFDLVRSLHAHGVGPADVVFKRLARDLEGNRERLSEVVWWSLNADVDTDILLIRAFADASIGRPEDVIAVMRETLTRRLFLFSCLERRIAFSCLERRIAADLAGQPEELSRVVDLYLEHSQEPGQMICAALVNAWRRDPDRLAELVDKCLARGVEPHLLIVRRLAELWDGHADELLGLARKLIARRYSLPLKLDELLAKSLGRRRSEDLSDFIDECLRLDARLAPEHCINKLASTWRNETDKLKGLSSRLKAHRWEIPWRVRDRLREMERRIDASDGSAQGGTGRRRMWNYFRRALRENSLAARMDTEAVGKGRITRRTGIEPARRA